MESDTWLVIARELARQPIEWIRSALHLRSAAAALWERIEPKLPDGVLTRSPLLMRAHIDLPEAAAWYMLFGHAIEDLLKALLTQQMVATGEDPVPNDQLHRRLRTHNLNELANAANVTLSDEETAWLELLTQYVTWAGTYPFPTSIAVERQSTPVPAFFNVIPERSDAAATEALFRHLCTLALERDTSRSLDMFLGMLGYRL